MDALQIATLPLVQQQEAATLLMKETALHLTDADGQLTIAMMGEDSLQQHAATLEMEIAPLMT
jgi:hypothetical protein